jgi:hypothetical protein
MNIKLHPENDPEAHPGHTFAWVAIVAFIAGLLAGEILRPHVFGDSRAGWTDNTVHPRRIG